MKLEKHALIRWILPCLALAALICAAIPNGREGDQYDKDSISAAQAVARASTEDAAASSVSPGGLSSRRRDDGLAGPTAISPAGDASIPAGDAAHTRLTADPVKNGTRRSSRHSQGAAAAALDADISASTATDAGAGEDPVAAPAAEELAALPIVFQIDPAAYLPEGEASIVADQQQRFADELARGGEPIDVESPEYRRRWDRARFDADNRLRLELGAEGFNRLASDAMQAAEQGK